MPSGYGRTGKVAKELGKKSKFNKGSASKVARTDARNSKKTANAPGARGKMVRGIKKQRGS